MKQRFALVLMGAWLAGTICVSVVATENFYTIDRLLAARANAAFGSAVDQLGSVQGRDLLRYLSSELNRLYFQLWNWAQVALGLLTLWLIAGSAVHDPARARLSNRLGAAGWSVGVMLVIVVLMLAWLTPAIVTLGRSLDFVPRDPAPAGMSRFWVLHAAYTSLEMIKLLIGAAVVYVLARDRSPRPALQLS